jgi:hypothetical protein
MNVNTLFVFKQIMAKGYISREDNELAYSYMNDAEVAGEMEMMGQELDFELYRANGRIYIIPNQTNELFLQGNRDFRKMTNQNARLDDLYLFNYIGIYILYIFYHGSGKSPVSRDFIKEEDLISDFTSHCEQIRSESQKFENAATAYSIDFVRIAEKWLAKTGEDCNKLDSKYGCVRTMLRFFEGEELFFISENSRIIKPTRKLNDLMPYFLSQQRIKEINSVFSGGESDADNK